MINSIRSIADLVNGSMPGGRVNYTAPAPAPALPGTPAFTSSAPIVKAGSQEYRSVPPAWQSYINDAYKAHPNLPRGLLEAVLMNESSMGTISSQYDKRNGESGWIAGMTDPARQHLNMHNIPNNLDTQQGAINGMADYLSTRQSGTMEGSGKPFLITDPTKLYFDRYKTDAKMANKTTPADVQKFKSYVQYYGQPRTFNNLAQ